VAARKAGDDHAPPVYPHPHIHPRDQERVASAAELPAEPPIDTDALAHGDLSRELHAPAAPFRFFREERCRLQKERLDPLAGDLSRAGLLRSSSHAPALLSH